MSDTPAEYKQVTVLFADVVRSMDIAATVGAERLREIMTELVTCAAAVVPRYGGTVDKFTSRMARRHGAGPGDGPQRRPDVLRRGRRLHLLPGIPLGVLRPDDRAVREIEDAHRTAERSGDDLALSNASLTLGVALVNRPTDPERDRGEKLLAAVSDGFLRRRHNMGDLPIVEVYLAREPARHGDRDGAIPLMRVAIDRLVRAGQLLAWGIPATAVLVETLLDRGADVDVAEAQAAIERFAAAPGGEGVVVRDIWLLRLRTLLAQARGDAAAYTDFTDRYRDMAKTLGFKRHIAWADARP